MCSTIYPGVFLHLQRDTILHVTGPAEVNSCCPPMGGTQHSVTWLRYRFEHCQGLDVSFWRKKRSHSGFSSFTFYHKMTQMRTFQLMLYYTVSLWFTLMYFYAKFKKIHIHCYFVCLVSFFKRYFLLFSVLTLQWSWFIRRFSQQTSITSNRHVSGSFLCTGVAPFHWTSRHIGSSLDSKSGTIIVLEPHVHMPSPSLQQSYWVTWMWMLVIGCRTFLLVLNSPYFSVVWVCFTDLDEGHKMKHTGLEKMCSLYHKCCYSCDLCWGFCFIIMTFGFKHKTFNRCVAAGKVKKMGFLEADTVWLKSCITIITRLKE